MKETIIALAPIEFSKIKIQTIIYQKEGKTYINSVNILCGSKIIKKIRQKPGGVEMEMYKSEQIVSDYLLQTFQSEKKSVSHPSQKTKKDAAKSIMNEFNL
jgi:hypothetical protein